MRLIWYRLHRHVWVYKTEVCTWLKVAAVVVAEVAPRGRTSGRACIGCWCRLAADGKQSLWSVVVGDNNKKDWHPKNILVPSIIATNILRSIIFSSRTVVLWCAALCLVHVGWRERPDVQQQTPTSNIDNRVTDHNCLWRKNLIQPCGLTAMNRDVHRYGI